MTTIKGQQSQARKDKRVYESKLKKTSTSNQRLKEKIDRVSNSSQEFQAQFNEIQKVPALIEELESSNRKAEKYILRIKNNTESLGSELAEKHREQVQSMKELNQELVKENSFLTERLDSIQKELERTGTEYKAKETHLEEYIHTLKQRCCAEDEWKKYYKRCADICYEEYKQMLGFFKQAKDGFNYNTEQLRKCEAKFFKSFPSKVDEAEKNVKAVLSSVQNFISRKEDERKKYLQTLITTFKDLRSRIKSLNSDISEFNSKLVMSERQHEEFKTRDNNHQIAQILEVSIKPIEDQLQEQVTKAQELRTELGKQDRETRRSKGKEYTYKGCSVKVVEGEATQYQAGALVCPANEALEPFGSEAELIRNEAGEKLDQQCDDYIQQHGRLPQGKAALFKAGNLKHDYAILASVPYYADEDKYHRRSKVNMHRLVKDILSKIVTKDIEKIVIPILVTKETNFPKIKYAKILAFVLRDFIDEYKTDMENKQIILCAQKTETCETLNTYLTEALHEKQREASPNYSSDEETNERQEAYLQEIERERRRVMGRENKFERKSQKKVSPRKDSPDEEDYHTPPETNENECKKCGREIKDRSHQANGKHKNRCIKCYNEKRAQKRSDKEEQKRSKKSENQNWEEDSKSD